MTSRDIRDDDTAPIASSEEQSDGGRAVHSQETIGLEKGSDHTSSMPTTLIREGAQAVLIDNRFAVEKELGRGGIGVAYLAADLQDNRRPVVIKALLERPCAEECEWVERHFREEVKALARIDHPGVVKLVASGEMPDGRPYLAMEFIEGRDLRSQIEPERGLGDFERIARIVRKLGEAVSAAHDKGVYHRDLKPENIMLFKQRSDGIEEEQVKVIDFGISTVKDSLDEKTRATVLAGSIRYMAPEQLQGRPSASSDIYALGVIAYEVITGRTPFNPDVRHPFAAMTQLLDMQRAGVRVMPKDLRPSLPIAAQEVILKSLAYNPRERHQRSDQFGDELAKALTETAEEAEEIRGVSAPASGASQVLQRSKSFRAIVAVASVILLVLVSIVGWRYLAGSAGSKRAGSPPVMGELPERSLSYWAELQKYRGDRPFGDVMRLTGGVSGETYFSAGDGIRFFVTAPDDGYLYLINEEAGTGGPSSYTVLFPSPAANNASSELKAGQPVATSECVFDRNAGTEKVWIIWSASRIEELEDAVRLWANPKDEGSIKDPAKADYVRGLLSQNAVGNLQVERDGANERMKVSGKGDILVYLLKLHHR